MRQASTFTDTPSHAQSGDQLRPRSSQSADGPMSIVQRILNLDTRLPKSVANPLILDDQWFIGRIAAQVERTMGYWCFNPPCDKKEQLQLYIRGRLSNTKFTRWIYLAVTGVIESFFTGDMSHVKLHNSLIGSIEGSLRTGLALELAPRDMRNQWSDWIHVSLMVMLFNNLNTYQALRTIAPVVLQVTYATPTLWPADSDLTRVPLSNILASTYYELTYFALADCTYAMLSGLPQQIEYNTDVYSPVPLPSWHQLTHEFPTELILVLADINACRDNSPYARGWRDIECQLLTWQPRPGQYNFAESWVAVAWYAVQESWRLALLVYLYLAVCNASSDDPRIESCAKQILQVAGTVKKRRASDASVSFCNQYLMVGICARSEADRKMIREKLVSANEAKLWIIRTSVFSPALEHLWNGAGANGRPIRWSDYVYSRETVFPITI